MYQIPNQSNLRTGPLRGFQGNDSTQFLEDNVTFSTRTSIARIEDLVSARQAGRLLAQELGFSPSRSTLATTIISELARNIVLYAGSGEIVLSRLNQGPVPGILITAIDHGPGIEDVEHAVKGGVSSSGSLGLGLSGVKQLADDFEVVSIVGEGTTVAVTVWRR